MRYYTVVSLAAFLVGCGGSAPPEESPSTTEVPGRLAVYVTNYPLQYFAERVGGDRVEVTLPVPTGKDPATLSPDPETVAAYQRADLVLLNGADYEPWVNRVALSPAKLVDTSKALGERVIHVPNAMTHSHGPEGEHSHGETSSVTWLDMTLAVQQAKAIRDALVKARPSDESYFNGRFERLETDLLGVDQSIRQIVEGKTDRPLLASYPVYPYLARRYQLDIDSLRYDPADLTGGSFWHDLEHTLEEHKAHWMFWEREPSAETAEKLRGYDVKSVVFDPCGAQPTEGDFLSVMKANVENLRTVFSN